MNIVDIVPAEYDVATIQSRIQPYLAPLNVQGKHVVLKPSMVSPTWFTERTLAANTHPALITGVAAALENLGARQISVVESETLGPARYAFKVTGLSGWIRQAGLKRTRFVYLDEVRLDRITLKEGIEVRYPRMVKEADLYITLPKFKANIFSDLTLAVKNNLGLILRPDRFRYHSTHVQPGLHELLAHLHRVRAPELCIMDAIVAGHRQGPSEADPVPLGVVLIGPPLAVDKVLCQAVGRTPRHIQILEEMGEMPADIQVNGQLPALNFELPRYTCDDGATVCGNEYCPAGCSGMVQALRDSYARSGAPIKNGAILVKGEMARDIPGPVVLFGDCAIRDWGTDFSRTDLVKIPGCPPDYVVSAPAMGKAFGPNPWAEKYFNVKLALWSMLLCQINKTLNRLFGR